MAKENYQERMMRESFRRESTLNLNNRTLSGGNPVMSERETCKQTMLYPMNRQRNQFQTNHCKERNSHQYIKNRNLYEEDEDEGTLLQTCRPSNQYISIDKRPITPMIKKIETSFNEDGLPLDPKIANEYYQSYENDFEYDSSPERKSTSRSKFTSRNSLSKTIAPSRRREARKPGFYVSKNQEKNKTQNINNMKASHTYGAESPLSSTSARMEYEQLLGIQNQFGDYQQNEINDTFGDDKRTSVFGSHNRATKIQNLRRKAENVLGSETFEKCYTFLKEKRRSIKNSDEATIFEGLKHLVDNPADCFLVDQLLFLEES